MTYHVPVLLKESIEALHIDPDGIYVDVTFGGGGHSREILKRLKKGRLIVFDRDITAKQNVEEKDQMIFVHQNFRHLKKYLKLYGLIPVKGILADLGVSSYQFDTAERGFSVRFDAELDMRMDQSEQLTAKEVLNQYSEKDLVRIFSEYGEIRNAKTLALKIVKSREDRPIETIGQLKEIVQPVIKGNPNKYFAQVFQAIRIEVNKELEALEELLKQSAEVLDVGGRLVVITYHSLEDRPVKNFMKSGNVIGEIEKDEFGKYELPFRMITKKPVRPEADEIKRNSRARSAKLRVAEKI